MKQRKPRKPPEPKPIWGVTIVDFYYSYTQAAAPSKVNPYSSPPPKTPKKPKKPKPSTFVWAASYRSTAPLEEKQKDEIRPAVMNRLAALGYFVKSSKYIKSANPALYLQIKLLNKETHLFEIKRVK